MATDHAVTLRRVLAELKALRLRIDRQIASVQKALRRLSGGRSRPAKRARTVSSQRPTRKKTEKRAVGFTRDRQALARRLSRKTSK